MVRFILATVLVLLALPASAQLLHQSDATQADPTSAQDGPAPILIQNARIFDGVSEDLVEGQDVLVQDGMIAEIAAGIEPPEGAVVIDAGGRVITPGFIYMHEHIMMQASSPELLIADDRYIAILATQTARDYLDRGITTIRDAAGNTFGLKQAIDRGVVPGPRIYPSGAMISQSSGHADHNFPSEPTSFMAGGRPDRMILRGDFVVVNGEAEVLHAVREQLRRGASQIKIANGGGTGSIADPLEVTELLPQEIRMATQAAADFGTYTMTHVYNTSGVRRAIENGVKSIEHGNLLDKETHLRWSPEQIANRLRRMKPDDPAAHVSHETIYAAIYAQPRGGLKDAMIEALRQSKPKRGNKRRTAAASSMVPETLRIINRPEEVEARLVPGHWEGDLIKGAFNRSSVGTLVERKTRFVVLCKMDGNGAEAALESFSRQMKRLPAALRKSMTYDRGSEMVCHPELARRLKIPATHEG
jgi:imidazolonepropionase-like amidohydrolase